MKSSAIRIERMLEKIEARLVPPPRKCLSAIIDDIDDEATVKKKKEKALAEHVARHPEDAGRTVKDFKWIVHEIVHSGAREKQMARRRAEEHPSACVEIIGET